MGYYIQGPTKGKDEYIVSKYNGKIIPMPKLFSDIPSTQALICVVSNGPFEAAGYCFDEKEFMHFTIVSDVRPKTWLVMDKDEAEKLSGYIG